MRISDWSSGVCSSDLAPIGYLSSFQALCERNGADFFEYLEPGSEAELHHFIGKDIVNFHGLFWPAVLHGAGMRAPTRLHVNGYLTVDGAKMSKSRGTFVMARTWPDSGLPAGALRSEERRVGKKGGSQ